MKNENVHKIKVGISSCLLGNKVRFDGQHKRDRFITDTLSKWCDFVPVCPEVECGLPVPRESMRLVGRPDSPRLITGKTGTDHTSRMVAWYRNRLPELEKEDLVAFIFKTKSPSSGLRGVKVYNSNGNPVSHDGRGLFAAAFTQYFPDIPVEDEGRLHDPGLRENFIETIFVLQRWRDAVTCGGASDLVDFHSRHKYTLMAHDPGKLKLLGKITADIGKTDFHSAITRYRTLLGELLSNLKTVNKNYNVLLHMAGYFRENLTSDEREELHEASQQYHHGLVPLIVPLTLFRHYVRKYREPYLGTQVFLNPHPAEMGLLNHV